MKSRQIIFTFVFVVLAVCLEWWLFRTITAYGTTVTINVDQGSIVTISGDDFISVSAEDDGYFRIYAGEDHLIATPDNEDLFLASSNQFPASNWEIREGQRVEVTLNSDRLIVVKVEQPLYSKVIGMFLVSLVLLLIWLLVFILLS